MSTLAVSYYWRISSWNIHGVLENITNLALLALKPQYPIEDFLVNKI